jgi:osmotically-inducible protein OsmY
VKTDISHSREPPVNRVNETEGPVRELAGKRLRDGQYRALAEVTCEFHEGVLILRGRVTSFFLKQIAQTVVRNVEGVIEIDNRLEVD